MHDLTEGEVNTGGDYVRLRLLVHDLRVRLRLGVQSSNEEL